MTNLATQSWYGLVRKILYRIGITGRSARPEKSGAAPAPRETFEQFLDEMKTNNRDSDVEPVKPGSQADHNR